MQGSFLRCGAAGPSRGSLQFARFNPAIRSLRSRWWQASHIVVVAALAAFCIVSPRAHGSTINYGNFGPVPPGVSFLSVTESSGTDAVPLFGPPTPFSTGLNFDPQNFVAFASGGASDITDGQLNFSIKTNGVPNLQVNLFEAGDYTLAGAGTTLTQVFAGASIHASVTEIGGVPVAPIAIPGSSVPVNFNLVANPGIVRPWSLSAGLTIPAALGNVTRLDVVIDNQLLAISELASTAFIAKKDFIITTTPGVPEPVTLVLLLMGLPFAMRESRRR